MPFAFASGSYPGPLPTLLAVRAPSAEVTRGEMSRVDATPRVGSLNRSSVRGLAVFGLVLLFMLAGGSHATAAGDDPGATDTQSRRFLGGLCKKSLSSEDIGLRSAANIDLYHGLFYLASSAAISNYAESSRNWTGIHRFDDSSRSSFRLTAISARRNADRASDALIATSIAIIPAASIAASLLRTGDCAEAWDMTTDFVESFGLTLLLTESLKSATGRTRPFVEECDQFAPADSDCGGEDRFRSFVSGHASLAATGAGLTCAFSLKREAWGSSFAGRVAPCALGVGTALTTGLLRVASDRHWLTDVLTGFVVGGAIGYFDTWGPLEWLKIENRDSEGRIESLGVVLPAAVRGRAGLQFTLIY